MTGLAVRCLNLSRSFGPTPAVDGVSLELERGSSLALLGPSGCGKSTLLRLIAGLEVPDAGTIEVGDRTVAGPGVFVPPEQRRVGIIFQDYALFPHLDVAANIAFGLRRRVDRLARVDEMLSLVGLTGLRSRKPHQLSGGEQQRVALARALAPGPEILLLDEPFSNLDADLRERIRVEVKAILTNAGATVVFVTHDREEAMFMGERVGVMNNGRLEQVAAAEIIYHRPATPFVARFVGSGELLQGVVRDGCVATEIGAFPLSDPLSDGGKVCVMLRPDSLDLEPAESGVGVIVARTFLGADYLYEVRLPSGAIVRSRQPVARSYQPGTRVQVVPRHENGVVVFPAEEICRDQS